MDRGFEPRLHARRQIVRYVRRHGDVAEVLRLFGDALHEDLAALDDDVVGRGLEQMRADLDDLLADLLRGFVHGDAAHRKAAAPERANPHARRLPRFGVPDLDGLPADAEGPGPDLRP